MAAIAALGETINVMTLGGLALAVGMLVDEGTVTLENIFYHLEMGKPVEPAILDGAQQIVVPAFVTLLVLDIVFAPMFQLGGVAGYLFRPLAEAVVFALIGSFILSRTLVPTMARYLLSAHTDHGGHDEATARPSRNPFKRFQMGFEKRFASVRDRYRSLLALALKHPISVIVGFIAFVIFSFGLQPFLGENFFPSVDSGQILMHVRAQPGTRIEETARLFDLVEQTVRQTIPPSELDNIVDNIGLPYSGINMAYQNTGTIGPEDGDALISLKEDHAPTADYIKRLRTVLPQKFPGATFSFLPADIVSQILNFGLPAPIDVQVIGNNQKANYAYANDLLKRLRTVPGVADLRIQQMFNYPQINVEVDRTLAGRGRTDAAGCRQQPAGHSVRQSAGAAKFLAEQRKWRLLSDRRANAAIPCRYDLGSRQCAGDLVQNKDPAIPRRACANYTGTEPRGRLALQRATGRRYLWRDSRTGPRFRRRRHRSYFEHDPKGCAARFVRRTARTGAHHDHCLQPASISVWRVPCCSSIW